MGKTPKPKSSGGRTIMAKIDPRVRDRVEGAKAMFSLTRVIEAALLDFSALPVEDQANSVERAIAFTRRGAAA